MQGDKEEENKEEGVLALRMEQNVEGLQELVVPDTVDEEEDEEEKEDEEEDEDSCTPLISACREGRIEVK